MRVTKPGDRPYVKALIYGPAGQGKTTFLGTAQNDERTYPMLFVDFEGGTQSLSGLDIDVAEIRDWHDYNAVYRELASGKTEYQSIGLDSVSETQIFSLLEILEQEGKKGRDDPDKLQQQDYGKSQIQMRRLLRSFRDLPMHLFATAGAKSEVEPRIGTVKKPALSGQLAEEIPAMMDVVTYLAVSRDQKTGEEVRMLLLRNGAETGSQFRVKVRQPWGVEVPELIEEQEEREFAERGVSILLDTLQIPGGSNSAPKKKTRRNR